MARVEDGLLLMDTRGGFCYALNGISARVWDILAEPADLDSICDTLCRDFAVDRATCISDVTSLISDLQAAGLVR